MVKATKKFIDGEEKVSISLSLGGWIAVLSFAFVVIGFFVNNMLALNTVKLNLDYYNVRNEEKHQSYEKNFENLTSIYNNDKKLSK